MRLVILILLLSCNEERLLDSGDRREFENSWWEVDCPYNECPLCFKLNQDHSIETYDLDLNIQSQSGAWSFKNPNEYHWEIDDQEYKIIVTPAGDCWDLKHSIFKLEACPCSVELPV